MFSNISVTVGAGEYHHSTGDNFIQLGHCGGLCHQSKNMHSQVVMFGGTVIKRL